MAKKTAKSLHDSKSPESYSPPSPTRKTEIVRHDDIPTFYVNSVHFELSNWDLKMRMGQIESGDHATLTVGEVLRVYMSHAHAKAFAVALNRMIAKIDVINEAGDLKAAPDAAH